MCSITTSTIKNGIYRGERERERVCVCVYMRVSKERDRTFGYYGKTLPLSWVKGWGN